MYSLCEQKVVKIIPRIIQLQHIVHFIIFLRRFVHMYVITSVPHHQGRTGGGGGVLRFQETPLKTTKTNKILYSFRLDPGNKVKL